MNFEVEFQDGTTKEVEIPKHLPFRVGKKCRRKLKSVVEGNQNKAQMKMENPLDKITDIDEVLVEELLGNKVDTDKITTRTADRLGEQYWDEIQQKKGQ